MQRETVTTALDVVGLLLVAAGLAFFLWPIIGGAALACAGGLLLVGSALAVDRPTKPARRFRRSREVRP